MKKTIIVALLVIAASFIACQNPNIAVIEVDNPEGENIAFSGYYISNMADSANVTGTTPATYEIDVDAADDYVIAGFLKTTITDFDNELRIELKYMGESKAVVTVKAPLVPGVVRADIP